MEDVPSPPGRPFSWVYDCGSRRSQPLQTAIEAMVKWPLWPATIDMVVLSHFDDDHVNGLELLLKDRRVKWLVLPFSDWELRLREVCVGGEAGMSPSTALLQLDPVDWLRLRGLSEQVDSILMVQGGGDDEEGEGEPPNELTPLPLDPDSDNLDGNWPGDARRRFHQVPLSELQPSGHVQLNANVPKVFSVSHRISLSVPSLRIELMFYNAELDSKKLGIITEDASGELFAKRSKVSLSKAKQDIATVLTPLNLGSPGVVLPKGWRSSLKAAYEKHFGSTSSARNNISLCMLVRPLNSKPSLLPCNLFRAAIEIERHVRTTRSALQLSRPAVLCTGDLRLEAEVINSMERHFGPSRWQEVGLTQVPHHGSPHSWSTGNANALAPTAFVHCAPGTSAHPHPKVTADLTKHTVYTADYQYSVDHDYHF
jgi:hypothetical protein